MGGTSLSSVRILAAALALLAAEASPHTKPSRFEPQTLAFWDARHGLVAGFEFRDNRRRAVARLTSDGGRTWRTVRRGIGPYGVAVVRGGRHGWIALPGALLRTGDRGRTWSVFSRARVSGPSFATPTDGWAIAGGRVVATHDGGVRWRPLRHPCGRAARATEPQLALATATHGWILCLGQPGAGQQLKAIYETRDGGRSWRLRATDFLGVKRRGNIPGDGYASGISFLANGHGWLAETRGSFWETRDGGTRWRSLPISRPDVVEAHAAQLLSDRVGVALIFYSRRLAVTRDGGRSWRYVTRFAS
jgi:photosystem II stability/assembly factor-like uncharacterized protein